AHGSWPPWSTPRRSAVARPGSSTTRTRWRASPGRRPPRARGSPRRTRASASQAAVRPPAGRERCRASLHLEDRPDLDHAILIEDRVVVRERDGLVVVLRRDDGVPHDDILRLRVGPVAVAALLVLHDASALGLERLAVVREMAALLHLLEP